ncbi:MAG: Spy/CpxP family protein refolding chaperone [Candidatus Kryptonium sp.]
MKVKIILSALVLVLIASPTFAQIFGPRFGMPPDDAWQRGITRLYDELKLTDEQKSKLQNLFFEFRKTQADIAGKLNKAKIELQELLSVEKIDKSAIDKKLSEISRYRDELSKNKVNHWLNVQQVLTPEQRKILREKLGYPGLGIGPYKKMPGWGKLGRGLRRCW